MRHRQVAERLDERRRIWGSGVRISSGAQSRFFPPRISPKASKVNVRFGVLNPSLRRYPSIPVDQKTSVSALTCDHPIDPRALGCRRPNATELAWGSSCEQIGADLLLRWRDVQKWPFCR